MRNFIVSDLHGQGIIYEGIKDYLKSLKEEYKLYVDGDIIDRGPDSIPMLCDIMDNTNIETLVGNHEYFMYLYLTTRFYDEAWFYYQNGGYETLLQFNELSSDRQKQVQEYLTNLHITRVLPGINGFDGITLSHASPLRREYIDITLKDNKMYDYPIYNAVWKRRSIPQEKIGWDNYINIIGHTPNMNAYSYNKYDTTLNIDGGCSAIRHGFDVTVPLVEINYEKDCLDIIKFNTKGEIIDGESICIDKESKILRKIM